MAMQRCLRQPGLRDEACLLQRGVVSRAPRPCLRTCNSVSTEQSKAGAAGSSIDPNVATLLIGSIGGTNACFELVDADVTTGERVEGQSFAQKLATQDFSSIEEALQHFISSAGVEADVIACSCLACAGPVVDNTCAMTNLKWVVDGHAIAEQFGMRTTVLNDFVAVGYAIPTMSIPEEVVVINEGRPQPGGPIAVVGPGTGLGEVQLMWDSGYQDYEAWASEGSHAGFAPRGELQQELLRFAEEELELPCEVEHVACGIGITRIYRFLCDKRGVAPQSLRQEEITERGMAAEADGGCPVCSETVDLFLEIIGAEAGAMALRAMATGGVYVAGGIVPRLLARLDGPALRDAFLNRRSRFSRIAKRFPFYVLRSEAAGMQGVYNYAITVAQQRR
eukprot:jgi/Ulvmu1/6823/UM031_0027.1